MESKQSACVSLLVAGLQLVRQCQEAAEKHGEAAGPELGAQDQALQQVRAGQRREAERQQRRQLLRRYLNPGRHDTAQVAQYKYPPGLWACVSPAPPDRRSALHTLEIWAFKRNGHEGASKGLRKDALVLHNRNYGIHRF